MERRWNPIRTPGIVLYTNERPRNLFKCIYAMNRREKNDETNKKILCGRDQEVKPWATISEVRCFAANMEVVLKNRLLSNCRHSRGSGKVRIDTESKNYSKEPGIVRLSLSSFFFDDGSWDGGMETGRSFCFAFSIALASIDFRTSSWS